MPNAKHASGLAGSNRTPYSAEVRPSASPDSVLAPLRFHQNPSRLRRNNCKLKAEDDCVNMYNKLRAVERNPSPVHFT